MQVITSKQNSKIKLANSLTSKRQREKNGLFLVDYWRDLERALDCDYDVAFAFYCEALASDDDRLLMSRINDDVLFAVDADLMDKASYRQNPGGLVAVMQQKPTLTINDAGKVDSPHILGLVNLRKPGNIGALLRTADAAGIDMILLIDTALDIYNPNIIRASTGAVFLDNIYVARGDDTRQFFAERNIATVAAHIDGTMGLYDVNFTARRTAILLGSEATGLETQWVTSSDYLVKIPMVGRLADSLNVSVSGAIFMYEALRQRQTNSPTD